MSAADNITWRRWAFYNIDPQKYPRGDQPNKEMDQLIFSDVDGATMNNIMSGWDGNSWNPSKVQDVDWAGMVSQTGITHEHTLRASGGTDKMRSSFSFGYLNNEGTQKGQKYERYNVAINTDITPLSWFTMGGSINASISKQEYGMSGWGQTAQAATDIYGMAKVLHRYAVPYDSEGNVIIFPGVNGTNRTVVNEWEKSSETRKTDRILGSFYATVDFGKMWAPVDGLSYKFVFGPDLRNYRNGQFASDESAARKGQLNLAASSTNRTFSWTLDNQLVYSKDIAKNHFDATLVQTASKYLAESTSQQAEGIPKNSYLWNNMGSVDITNSNAKMGSGLSEWQMASYLGRIHYSFDNKYLLTVTGRYDGASMLAKGNKWAFFPSTAVAWRVNQESFMKDIKWINNLKLRVGVGVVGNSAVGSYVTLGNITSFYVPFGGKDNTLAYAANEPFAGLGVVSMANPELTWEKTTQYNYGIDFGFLNNRLLGTFEIYHSRTTDLIFDMTIPTLTGYRTTKANVGETKNFGVDFSLTAIPVATKDVEWVSSFIASYQKEKIVELANGKQDMVDNNLFIGESIDVFYDYAHSGLWQSADAAEIQKFNDKGSNFQEGFVRPIDQNGDYVLNKDNDYIILGNKNPRWTLGWSNNFTWKGLELAVELYGQMGYMVSVGGQGQSGRTAQRKIDYWTPDNLNAEWQKPVYNEAGGSADSYNSLLGYQDAAFIKVRNVSLGYFIPSNICSKVGLSNLKIYAQLKNPGNLYSSVKNLDLDMRTSYYNRGIIFGLQIDF
jgi:TonB-linked SusC/RagA family outer membrane protein